jgi:hypothetical protein
MTTKLLIKDLMLRSKVKEWIKANYSDANPGVFEFIKSVEDLPLALTGCNHLVLDLNLIQQQVEAVIARIREVAPSVRITGFGSHVDKELHSEARRLGLDAVLPRSKFFGDLGKWLDPSVSN